MKSLFTRKSLAVVSAMLVASVVTSCHDEEVANIEELSYRHGYEYNFVKTFGEIDPNQTWDFSRSGRKGHYNNALTRAGTDAPSSFLNLKDGVHYYVTDSLLMWLKEYGLEDHGNGQNRPDPIYIHPFVFSADPDDEVQIVPVYMGQTTGLGYHLYAVSVDQNGNEIASKLLWKIEDPHIDTSDNGKNYTPLTPSASGGSGGTWKEKYVRATPFTLDFGDDLGITQPNTTVYFYLLITHPQNGSASLGTHQTSISNPTQMIVFECPEKYYDLSDKQGYNAMLIGCESANLTPHADYDYNDIVFLMCGWTPNVIHDETESSVKISKRYLIEDLYGFDYDFNDIVLDLTQVSKQKFDIEYAIDPITNQPDKNKPILVPKKDEQGNVIPPVVTQEATIQWLCGTLPFQIGIGEYTFNQVTDPTNKDQTNAQLAGTSSSTSTYSPENGFTTGIAPKYTVNFSQTTTSANPWIPASNNISASIWTKGTSPSASADGGSKEGVWKSEFPAAGEVPYIIAVDQDQKWTKEFQNIVEIIPNFNKHQGDMSKE